MLKSENWSTIETELWVSHHRRDFAVWLTFASAAVENARASGVEGKKEVHRRAAASLAERLAEAAWNKLGDAIVSPFIDRLCGSALDRINWTEIAREYVSIALAREEDDAEEEE